jgi:ribosomal protein L27
VKPLIPVEVLCRNDGPKIWPGAIVERGTVLWRQSCGLVIRPGYNVGIDVHNTLYAICRGKVVYRSRSVYIEPVEQQP